VIFFCHIPKTGGQTLFPAFLQAFGVDRVLKVWDPQFGADCLPDDFASLSEKQLSKYRAIFGHLTVRQFLANPAMREKFDCEQVQILTTVREPVERFISLYNYMLRNEAHPGHKQILSIDPVDFLKSQHANQQFEYLKHSSSSRIDDVFSRSTPFPMEFSITAITEYFSLTYNITLESLQIKNRSTDFPSRLGFLAESLVDPETIASIREANYYDSELYGLCIKRYQPK
jgi:hypothetical protein